MKSTKCPQCGLVYWSTDANCKRCGMATSEPSGVEPDAAMPQYVAQQPMEVMNFTTGVDPVREKLLKNLRRDAQFFYFIGGLQIFVWFFIGKLLIVDGLLNVGLSFLVHRYKSRVAAIILLVLMLFGVMIGALAIATMGMSRVPLIPIIILIRVLTSARMVYTTFKLKGYAEAGPVRVLPPPPPVFQPEAAPQWTAPGASAQWQPTE